MKLHQHTLGLLLFLGLSSSLFAKKHAKKVHAKSLRSHGVILDEPIEADKAETRRGPQQVINTGVSLNQQISSSSLSSSKYAVNGQFILKNSGRYFLASDLHAAPGRSNVAIIHIEVSDVILDLGGRSITLSTTNYMPSKAAISIADGVNNVTILNGTINGQGLHSQIDTGIIGNNNANIMLDNIRCVNCKTTGISLTNANSFVMNAIQTTGGLVGFNAFGSSAGSVTDSSFDHAQGDTDPAFGLVLERCTDIIFDAVGASNNTSNTNLACGMSMIDTSGCSFTRFRTFSNNSGISPAAGISLEHSTGNFFDHCIVSNNDPSAPGLEVYGFYLQDGSNGNTFDHCESNNNGNQWAASCSGFGIDNSHSNVLLECIATGNVGGESVYGFRSFGLGRGLILRNCQAHGNFSAPDRGAAYGVALENETGGVIQNCEFYANTGANLGCGIALIGDCRKTTVEYNKILANSGAQQYGFWDQSPGSTTFLRGNISFGHGRVFENTLVLPENPQANYRFTFAEDTDQLNPQFLIKEADTANMNAFEASSPTWFNFSIVEYSVAEQQTDMIG